MLTQKDFSKPQEEFLQLLYCEMRMAYIQNKMVTSKVNNIHSITIMNEELMEKIGLPLTNNEITKLISNGFRVEESNKIYTIYF